MRYFYYTLAGWLCGVLLLMGGDIGYVSMRHWLVMGLGFAWVWVGLLSWKTLTGRWEA